MVAAETAASGGRDLYDGFGLAEHAADVGRRFLLEVLTVDAD